MTEDYMRVINKNGTEKIQKKIRKEEIEVLCTHCHRKRMTHANERCKCFYCGKSFKIKGDYHD